MVNLHSLEQLALDRQAEMRSQFLRRSLLWQAESARDGRIGKPAFGSSVRSRLGLLLVRVGLLVDSAALPQQQVCTRACVCVPVNN